MGKDFNKNQTTAPTTIEEALIVIANLEQANSTAENTIAELTENLSKSGELVNELSGKLSKSEELVNELTGKLSTSETMVSELINSASVLEGRIATGKITVEHNGQKYEVLAPKLPTLSQAAVLGVKRIAAGDAHKHPEVIAELISIESGFLKLVTE
jgi:chromosome segregation ATPase